MGWLDDLGDAAEGFIHDAERDVGSAVDSVAHGAGDVLNDVGLHSAAHWVDHVGDVIADRLGATPDEMNLGETDDPRDLVHGDPGAVDDVVSKLKGFGTGFTETASALKRIDTGSWTGQAANSFHSAYRKHPKEWDNASDAMNDAVGALSGYVETLRWAQGQAGLAIQQYNQMKTAAANKATDAAVREMAETAASTLSNARTQRNTAAATAAAAVKTATELAPKLPSFSDRMLSDAGDLVEFDALLGAHNLGGLVSGLGSMVKLGRSLNPTDPYNISHPAGYLQSVTATAAGFADIGAHPLHLVHGMIGNGWGSDPGDALGNVEAQIVAAAATGGGGEAADVAETAATAGLRDTVTDAGSTITHDSASLTPHVEPDTQAPIAHPEPAEPEPAQESQTTGSDQTEQQRRTDGTDPVDLATGEVLMPVTDLELPGVLGFRLSRMFLSSFAAGRSFGRRWASDLDQRVEVTENDVLLVGADASIVSYRHSAVGEAVVPERGPRRSLTRLDTGGYRVEDSRTGVILHFHRERDTRLVAGIFPLMAVTDRHNNRILYERNNYGVVTELIHSGGYRVRVGSDSAGRVITYDLHDPVAPGGLVRVREFGYDLRGRLVQVVNAVGSAERFEYDDEDRLVEWINRNGYAYRYAHDEQGRCIGQGGIDGSMASIFQYVSDPEGRGTITAHTDSLGATTYYRVNELAQVTAVTDAAGATTATLRDEHRRPLAESDALGRITEWRYNEDGDLTALVRPDGSQLHLSYSTAGIVSRVGQFDGTIWSYGHDEHGNLSSVIDPLGAITAFGYHPNGTRASVTDPLGARTTIGTNSAGLPTAVSDAYGNTTRYNYDAFGRVTKVTDPLGATTSFDWTIEGKLARRVYPDGATETWTYDAENNLLARTDPVGNTTCYAYGAFNTVISRTEPDGSVTRYGYDTQLQLTAVTNPQGLVWRYEYDQCGRLIREYDFNGRVLRYQYDQVGQLVERANGAGEATKYGYDQLGHRITASTADHLTSYAHDPLGRILIAENSHGHVEFERDPLGRVLAETVNGQTVRSVYDKAGRRLTRTTPNGVATGVAL